jgi:aryl-alcohol dehydrogenase-like predicted oxidoreductase
MFPLCQDQGLGHTPFSPLAGGWLTGKYRTGEPFPAGSSMDIRPDFRAFANEKTYPALEMLRSFATKRGVDMASLALAWGMSHPVVTAPLIRSRRPEHLDIINSALEIKLDADERTKIASFFKNEIAYGIGKPLQNELKTRKLTL